MADNTSGFLITLLGAAIVGAAAGVGGSFVGHQLLDGASPPAPLSEAARLAEEVAALQVGAGQKVVPLVVKEYITEQLKSVPHAKTADRAEEADWAETADHAVEADSARHAELADAAAEADWAEAAKEAGVASAADVAISAGEADFAKSASRADRANEVIGGPPKGTNIFVNEDPLVGGWYFTGTPQEEDEEGDTLPKRNIAQRGPVSVATRGENVVAALSTRLHLKEARPVYVALVDGSLVLDPESRGRYQLLRNGQPIHEGRLVNPAERDVQESPAGAVHTIDFPPAGTQVYTVRMIAERGRVGIYETRLLALEL